MKRLTALLLALLTMICTTALASEQGLLTPQQAEEAFLALYPTASVYFVHLEKDDGRSEYEMRFEMETSRGKAELDARTGELLEYEISETAAVFLEGDGPLTANEAKELALSLVENGRITEFEKDRDDGREVFEGEIVTPDAEYEFAIDAQTGRVIEWEMDKKNPR